MFKYIGMFKDLFLVYSEASKTGYRLSEQRIAAAGVVVSGALVQLLSLAGVNVLDLLSGMGVSNETFVSVGTMLVGAVFAWLRGRSGGGVTKTSLGKKGKVDAVSAVPVAKGRGEDTKQGGYNPLDD